MIYCDTSLLISALTEEPATADVRRWLRAQSPASLVVSGWTDTEVASGLAQKQRTGKIDDQQRTTLLTQWRRLMNSWHVLPIEQRHFHKAADLTGMGLRAGDALHLAVAADHGAQMATRDRELAVIARSVGLSVNLFD